MPLIPLAWSRLNLSGDFRISGLIDTYIGQHQTSGIDPVNRIIINIRVAIETLRSTGIDTPVVRIGYGSTRAWRIILSPQRMSHARGFISLYAGIFLLGSLTSTIAGNRCAHADTI